MAKRCAKLCETLRLINFILDFQIKKTEPKTTNDNS